MIVDIESRKKLFQKQQTEALLKAIRNNVPQMPEIPTIDLNPLNETLDKNLNDNNSIGEDSLSFSALNFEMLSNIDESLSEMVDLLKDLKNNLQPKEGDTE